MNDPLSAPLSLAADFPAGTRAQWLTLVEGVLKGRPFERLIAKTYDGLRIEPLNARARDAHPVAGRTPAAPWQVMQRVEHPDPAAANAEALHDLENGATGLSLILPGAIGAYGYWLDSAPGALARTLEGVHLDAGIALELELSPLAETAMRDLIALTRAGRFKPAAVDIRWGIDPLGAQAASGGAPLPWDKVAPVFADLIGRLAAAGFRGPFAAADGRLIHAAGGSEAQELAFVLAVAVAYLRALEAGGTALDAARRTLYFRLAADADQFLTTAKFRALRKLWAHVETACGLAPEKTFVAAETAWRMMARRDPHVNMLRTTVATFSAAIGGADAITVLPFTAALGLPDRLARRIARNTQLILAEESNLAKVANPAAGSGAIESLTDQLCAAAWTLFQEIEAVGGAAAALSAGLIQQKVAATRAARERAVARRTDALTGVSEFPNLAEAPAAVLDVRPPRVPRGPSAETCPQLPRARLAEPFEALRDASDRTLKRTGARPTIFLANLGTPSDFLTRATFAKNFFEAGGIATPGNDGFVTPPVDGEPKTDFAALVAAFKGSGASRACLCGSDTIYARDAVAAARALTAAGARHLYLAGRPGEHEAALRTAGVNDFIYAGGDVLATLRAAGLDRA